MVLNDEKFTQFLRETSCTCDGFEFKKDYKPRAILMNLNGWAWFCPNCFTLYNQDGKCRNCGMILEIEKRK